MFSLVVIISCTTDLSSTVTSLSDAVVSNVADVALLVLDFIKRIVIIVNPTRLITKATPSIIAETKVALTPEQHLPAWKTTIATRKYRHSNFVTDYFVITLFADNIINLH